MLEGQKDTHEQCIEATTRMMVALIESGKLPTEDVKAVGSYYAELYNFVYSSRLGRKPSSQK